MGKLILNIARKKKGLLCILILIIFFPQNSYTQIRSLRFEVNEFRVVPDGGYVSFFINLPNQLNAAEVEQVKSNLKIKETVNDKVFEITKGDFQLSAVLQNGSSTRQKELTVEKNIFLVSMDYSGSMKEDMLQDAWKALKTLSAKAAESKSILYFTYFDSYMTPIYRLDYADSVNFRFIDVKNVSRIISFPEMESQLEKKNTVEDENDTDLFGAIKSGCQFLKNEEDPFLVKFAGKKVFILLTDGKQQLDNGTYKKNVITKDPEADSLNLIQEILSKLPENIAIYPVGYGSSADNNFLDKVSQVTPNTRDKAQVSNINALESLFTKIAIEAKSNYQLKFRPVDPVFLGQNRVLYLSSKCDAGIFYAENNRKEYSFGSSTNIIKLGSYLPSETNVDGTVFSFKPVLLALMVYCATLVLVLLLFPVIYSFNFKKKYYKKYVVKQDSAHSCQYCGSEFIQGDLVVEKCAHFMHSKCWKENDYRCTQYAKGMCQTGTEKIVGPFDLLKNPFKIDNIANIILGATSGLFSFLSYYFFSNSIFQSGIYKHFEKLINCSNCEPFKSSVDGFFIAFFIALLIGIYRNRGNYILKTVLYSMVLIPVISAIAGFFLAGFLEYFSYSYFDNFKLLHTIMVWALLGTCLALLISIFSEVKYSHALLGGLVGGIFATCVQQALLKISPDIIVNSSAKIFFCATLTMVLSIVAKKLGSCNLKVTSGNYPSDKPFLLSKWLDREDLKKVVIGSNGKMSNIILYFDQSGLVDEKHIEILREGDKYFIQTISDKSQVLINQRPLLPNMPKTRIVNKDRIEIGETTMTFILEKLK